MAFDPVLNEPGEDKPAGYYKPPKELKKKKNIVIVYCYKIKSLPGISRLNAMKYPEPIC
jgi:hypothetical protein